MSPLAKGGMENESTEGRTLSLELPAALDEWLTERASELDVDRSELIRQLIGGYQVAVDTTDEESVEALEGAIETGTLDIEAAVQDAVDDAVSSAAPDEAAIADRVTDQVDDRIDALDAEMDEKLDDIRRRVVQVKQEADAKAPADHTHAELERLEQVSGEVERLSERLAELTEETGQDDDIAAELEDVQGKLTRLARAVVSMREDENGDRDEALADIRRKAAREGYEQATCGACGESVRVGLLPEAACPHCDSPLGDIIDGSGGLFGSSPRLVGPHHGSGDERLADGATGDEPTGTDPVSGITPDTTESDGATSPGGVDGDSEEPTPGDDGGAVSTDGGNDD
jgi:DNA repair exonuclease SbcCD ATPase subunit